jgi:hypothetical protein
MGPSAQRLTKEMDNKQAAMEEACKLWCKRITTNDKLRERSPAK